MAQQVAVQHMSGRETRVKRDRFFNLAFDPFPIPFLVKDYSHRLMAFGQGVIEGESLGCRVSSLGDCLSPWSRVSKQEGAPALGQSAIRGRISRVQLNGLIEIINRLQYRSFFELIPIIPA